MTYSSRYEELGKLFTLNHTVHLEESKVRIEFCSFDSQTGNRDLVTQSENFDDKIAENEHFTYPVFIPDDCDNYDKCILMMHGLNERTWNKYLTWAEYVCQHTHQVVILFPIAYHINRSPVNWSNPRFLQSLYEKRKTEYSNDRSISFANLALSERITNNPLRFYSSGKQSLQDLADLGEKIKRGKHPYLNKGALINIFAYSIGAFLSQILLMTNPGNNFSDSKIFLFCGGSIFNHMYGESRSIMDKFAFKKLLQYYREDFHPEKDQNSMLTRAVNAFRSMLSPESRREERMRFFRKLGERISGISLKDDKVIPYSGIELALGNEIADSHIALYDFPFPYNHENPFPVFRNKLDDAVNQSFESVFQKASEFLSR